MKISILKIFISLVLSIFLAYDLSFADQGVWVSGAPAAIDATLDELDNVTITADGNVTIQADDDGAGNEAFTVLLGTGGSKVTTITANTSTLTLNNATIDVNGSTTNLNGTTTNITGSAINLGNHPGDTTTVTGAFNTNGITTQSGIVNANGGIAVDTNKFTVADGSGNTTIGGTLDVTGITTTAGLANTGNLASTTLNTTGNVTVGGNMGIEGTFNANAGEVVKNGSAIYSGNGAGNTLVVAGTQAGSIGVNNFNYGTSVTGGMLVTGNLGVTGNIYSANPEAEASYHVNNNGLIISGASNTVSLESDNDALHTNNHTELTLEPTGASLLVNAENGQSHGIEITQTQTVITGGTESTSMTLNDNGVTFKNETTGGPARVTGVADGVNDYDATNVRQLNAQSATINHRIDNEVSTLNNRIDNEVTTINNRMDNEVSRMDNEVNRLDQRVDKAYAGIAAVSAIAAIPAPPQGKTFSVGLGYGNFKGYSGVALGGKANVTEDVNLSFGAGYSDEDVTTNAGIAYSW